MSHSMRHLQVSAHRSLASAAFPLVARIKRKGTVPGVVFLRRVGGLGLTFPLALVVTPVLEPLSGAADFVVAVVDVFDGEVVAIGVDADATAVAVEAVVAPGTAVEDSATSD